MLIIDGTILRNVSLSRLLSVSWDGISIVRSPADVDPLLHFFLSHVGVIAIHQPVCFAHDNLSALCNVARGRAGGREREKESERSVSQGGSDLSGYTFCVSISARLFELPPSPASPVPAALSRFNSAKQRQSLSCPLSDLGVCSSS